MYFSGHCSISNAFTKLKLKWLGLRDLHTHHRDELSRVLENALPCCTGLRTLSIRGNYSSDFGHFDLGAFCKSITDKIPNTVTNLELRMSLPSIDGLVCGLKAAKGNQITHIGLDLGAWVQVYSAKDPSNELDEESIIRTSIDAARRTRFETYEVVHNKALPEPSKWLLPQSWADHAMACKKSTNQAICIY